MSQARGSRGVAPSARTWPPPLRRGDRVHVVAPSAPVQPDLLARGVSLLESWGLEVCLGAHVLDGSPSGMLAGTDRHRAADLMAAWTDPDASAVLCARGGYGAGRLPGLLDWAALEAARPRWFVGSSDATVLHQVLGTRLGLVTAFGPMPATELLGSSVPHAASASALHDLLFAAGRGGDRGRGAVHASPAVPLRPGEAVGRLVGGNLTLVTAAVGTPDTDLTAGAVAFLEDVGEQPYRVDRMLTQLLRSGWFEGVRGVVLGTWEGCGEVVPVLRDRLGGLGVPVLAGLPVGHGPVQLSLPLGATVRLDVGAGTLSVLR